MIRRLKYHEIDFEKYDECVRKSTQYRIYAESWYLDAVTDQNWDCLVNDDYSIVMPLPIKRRFGIKFIAQPLFCQQLGIFSKYELTNIDFKQLVKKLRRMIVISYQFNEENTNHLFIKSKLRDNFILDLERSYETLFESYQRDRKKDVRRISKLDLKSSDEFDFLSFKNEMIKKYPTLKDVYESKAFQNLVDELIKQGKAYYKKLCANDQMISQIFIIKSKNRNILLFSSRDTDNQYKGAFTYLVDEFIKQTATEKQFLDFEGSMIEGIANYNASFGATRKRYLQYSNFG